MTAAKWITILVTMISTIVGALTINWQGLIQFGHSANFLYENVEELEHVLEDFHEVLGIQGEIRKVQLELDSLNNELFVRTNRDSLIHVIELMNVGKLPYDSIWRKSDSGHWYLTTVERHFNVEHND